MNPSTFLKIQAACMAVLQAKQEAYTVRVEGLNRCFNDWKSADVRTLALQ